MADEIHAGNQRTWTLTYNGKIDPGFTAEIIQNPEDMCTVVAGPVTPSPDNPAFDTQAFKVQHGGNVGEVNIVVNNDGDLGAGTVKISATRTFSMLAPGGATGVTDSLGDEEPIS